MGQRVDPPNDDANADDPVVSGDGSDAGSTGTPTPGSGHSDSTGNVGGVDDEGPELPPVAAAIQPASGPTAGGQIVDLHGANLLGVSECGGAASSLTPGSGFVFDTASRLRVTVPPGVAGVVDVRVRSGALESDAVPFIYTNAISAPTLVDFSPLVAPVTGTPPVSAVITGTGFSAPSVRFGEAAAQVTTWSPTSITAHSAGGDCQRSGADCRHQRRRRHRGLAAAVPLPGRRRASGHRCLSCRVRVSSPAGPPSTILGSGLVPGFTVTVGGAAATDVQVLSTAAMMATVPAGTAGAQTVRVTVPSQATAEGTFTYVPLAAPVLSCAGTDADGDRLPDAWEEQFGFSALDPQRWRARLRTATAAPTLQECQRPDASARALHAVSRRGRDRHVLHDPRRRSPTPALPPARVLFRFLTRHGVRPCRTSSSMPGDVARARIDLAAAPGPRSRANVSTVVESDAEVVVDRTMRWDQRRARGAHAESSVAGAVADLVPRRGRDARRRSICST